MSLSVTDRRKAHRDGESARVVENRDFSLSSTSSQQLYINSDLLPLATGILSVSNTAYWVYLGCAEKTLTIDYVKFAVTVVGAGTIANEIAIATSSSAANGAAQSLTVKAVNATLDDVVASTGVKGNTVALGYTVKPTTHIWAGVRFALTSTPTQPTIAALTLDMSRGAVLSTAAAGVLAVGTAYTGALIAHAVTAQAPNLFIGVRV